MIDNLIDDESFTFSVDEVSPAQRELATFRMDEAMKRFVEGDVESCSDYHTRLIDGVYFHPLLASVYRAHSSHYPLVLSPDLIWITITQGIAHHMMLHGERLRDRFVAHQGQLALKVEFDDWVEGSPENLWAVAFEEWCDQIKTHVGEEIHAALSCDFSTTTPTDRAVSHIVMMDVFQRYFRYEVYAVCGIPTITLEGSEADWRRLREKVDLLEKFDIDWWLSELKPICDQFVRARSGDVDRAHWRNICKLEEAYGGSIINGWIGKLFPYLRSFAHGPCTRRNWVFETGEGFQTTSAPSGLSRVPLKWINKKTGQSRMMEVVGGLAGVTQDPTTLALRAKSGWVIRRASVLDNLFHRVRSEHTVSDVAPEPRSIYADENEPDYSYFAEDLDRFLFEFDGVLMESGGHTIRVLKKSEVQPVDWGETPGKYGGSRGPEDKTWFRIAELDDGRMLLVNLDRNCRDPRSSDGFQSERLFGPICLSSEATAGIPDQNPVIAYTFSEWLEKTLDWPKESARRGDDVAYYWDAPDFEDLGDAMEFTQMETRF